MSSNTSKGLVKPDPIADFQDAAVLNANFDRLDTYGMGAFVCTSTTRPTGANLWAGLIIFETDTQFLRAYTSNSTWGSALNTPTYTDATRPANPIIGDRITDGNVIRMWNGSAWVCASPTWAMLSAAASGSWSLTSGTWFGLQSIGTLTSNDNYNFTHSNVTPSGSNITDTILIAEAGRYLLSATSGPGLSGGPLSLKVNACNSGGTGIIDGIAYDDKPNTSGQANTLNAVARMPVYLDANTHVYAQVLQQTGATQSWSYTSIGPGATYFTVERAQ